MGYVNRVVSFFDEDMRRGLAKIKSGEKIYKFHVDNHSILENLFLNKFWDIWTQKLYPMWLAPNLITLTGFVFMLISVYLLFLQYPYTENFDENLFRISCLLIAILNFLYSTFDGSDGKQARRTKSSSPLGENFDHGVDGISLSILIATHVMGSNLGVEILWFTCIVLWVGFFAAHWEHYYTHVFYMGHFSANDAQFAIITQYLYLFFTGTRLWSVTFGELLLSILPQRLLGSIPLIQPLLATPFRYLFLGAFMVGGCTSFIRSLIIIRRVTKKRDDLWKQAWNDLIPVWFLCMIYFVFAKTIPVPIFSEFVFYTFPTFGLCFALILTSYNLARVADTPFNVFSKQVVMMLLFCGIDAIAAAIPAFHVYLPNVLKIVCWSSTAFYLICVTSIIEDFCDMLQVNAFTIKKVQEIPQQTSMKK